MPKTYSSIWIHLIWTTRNRRPLLAKSFNVELCTFIRKNTVEKGMIVDMVNGIEDHMHALIRLKPVQSVSEVMKQIKGASARWINEEELLRVKFQWQQGYGALSVTPNDIEKVRKYIKNQERHHQKWELEDELQRFRYFDEEPQ
ncbi:MAG TPA: IS200/IS605 family transposase [Fodinibius sp.]|nr:IS200/IS605 family transposase [Fodinibius sp.]